MFINIKGKHLDGHKHISINDSITEYMDPDFVYFPLAVGPATYTKFVEVGSKVLLGQPILQRDGRFAHPVCSSVSGTVTGIKKMWHSSGKMIEMLEIENDKLYLKGYDKQDFANYTREDIVNCVKNAGIVGLGGAGFPTFVKYLPSDDADVIIVNAAECEPYITCDYMSIVEDSDKLIRGLRYIMKGNGAKKGVIAIKRNKHAAIDALKNAIKDASDISICLLKDAYPAGWEKYIVEKITKKSYSALPREVGAVVNNVQTVMAVCDAVEENKPLIERVVTVTGEGIKHPRNFRVRIGTKLSELLPLCDGYVDDLGDSYFICGGPMTGRGLLFDEVVCTPNVGSIIVKPKCKDAVSLNCIGCGKCAENCPAFLTPTAIKSAYMNNDTKELGLLNVNKCVQCGLCSYVCPSRVEMTDYMAKAKEMLQKANSVKK